MRGGVYVFNHLSSGSQLISPPPAPALRSLKRRNVPAVQDLCRKAFSGVSEDVKGLAGPSAQGRVTRRTSPVRVPGPAYLDGTSRSCPHVKAFVQDLERSGCRELLPG